MVLGHKELQFYRMRPFFVGGSGRLAAHVLQYAPSPSQRILGTEYGRHPAMCIGTSGDQCHGPHMCTSRGPQLRTARSAHTTVSLRRRGVVGGPGVRRRRRHDCLAPAVPPDPRRATRCRKMVMLSRSVALPVSLTRNASSLLQFLMAPPVAVGDELLWVGSTGLVYTLPMFRIAGLYAPANAEFSTQEFTMPSEPLWLNAAARWHGRMNRE